MKARIKKTGEIINIAEYAKVVLESCDSYGDPLELGFDEVEILQDKPDNIDWGQRRYEIVKNITNGLLVSYLNPNVYSSTRISDICRWAVSLADGIIEELKKGGRDAND